MPESLLMVEERAEEEFSRVRQKFHPHHDYLNLIIPSTWLVFWICLLDLYFYGAAHIREGLTQLTALEPFFSSASTSLEFFLALFLFIMVFTVIYVLGQLINGFSALMLDRLIVKKLLKYPFALYLRRLAASATVTDHEVLRSAMQESSYAIYCLNLIPVVFLELVVTAFSFKVSELPAELRGYSRTHGAASLLAAILLVWLHFGTPSRQKPLRVRGSQAFAPDSVRKLFRLHWLVLTLIALLQLDFVLNGWVWTILLLPVINLVLGLAERRVTLETSLGASFHRLLTYMRACFTNPIYLAANLVGYADLPSATLIRIARDGLARDVDEKDFFWITYLTVQNRGAGASQTAYHFLATYGMVRNLCNATAFALMASIGAFLLRWPAGHGVAVLIWSLALTILMYALFGRYLYVYASYFSKYVLRTAAYVARDSRPLLISS